MRHPLMKGLGRKRGVRARVWSSGTRRMTNTQRKVGLLWWSTPRDKFRQSEGGGRGGGVGGAVGRGGERVGCGARS